MNSKMSKNKGITLVALIVTIIILLILAGVTIAQLTGSGLFDKARLAKEKAEQAELDEQEKLQDYIDTINGKQLPANTPDTDAGTEVALEDGWGIQTVKYISTTDGTEVKEIEKIATVYAVSVGDGKTVPIPYGFYYVGGNLSTGVVISDNEADKYDGKIDKTAHSYATNLVGNQFVWIPCSTSEYKKCDTWNGIAQTGTTLQTVYWNKSTPRSELTQIEKYGGFYVARYESGLASNISEFTEEQVDDGSSKAYNEYAIPQSKAEKIPWNFIDYTHAEANSESMYNNNKYKNYISSGLITGTQWDVMLNKLVEKTDLESSDLTSSSRWGNYSDTAITYNGRVATAEKKNKEWNLSIFENSTSGTTTNYGTTNGGQLLTTGASSETKIYNTYDVLGNLWSWTEENSLYSKTEQYYVARGGSYIDKYDTYPVCYRWGDGNASYNEHSIGFRVVLYLK